MKTHETLSPEGRLLFWTWTIILSLASFVATALVIGEFFSGTFAQGFDWLGYFIGAGLDLAKLSLTAIVLVALWRKQLAKALSFSVIAIPLMVASITLSITFMSDTTEEVLTEKNQLAQSSSAAAQQIESIDTQIASQRDSLAGQIRTIDNLISDQRASLDARRKQYESNTEAKYRKVNTGLSNTMSEAEAGLSALSSERSELIKNSEDRISALINERSSLQKEAQGATTGNGDITLYGMDKGTIDMIILLTAVLIDITAVAGSAYLINDRIQRREDSVVKADLDRKNKIRSSLMTPKTSPHPQPQIQDGREEAVVEPKGQGIETKSGDEELVDIAIDLIFTEGVKPAATEIWKHGKDRGMSAKKAKKAMGILFDRGVITKNASGHFILSDNAAQLVSA